MTIKDVLVYTDNDEFCGNRVLSAVNLAHHYDAHVIGLYVTRMLVVHPYPYAYLPSSAFETLEAEAQERRGEVGALFESKTHSEEIRSEFRAVEGNAVDNVNLHSRYADLLVIPGRYVSGQNINPNYIVSDVLLGAACPVLMLPDAQGSLSLPIQRVLVAWDGSHESARALNAALSIFPDVKVVDVVSVSASEEEAKKIAPHIARHDREVNVHLAEGSHFNAGSALLNQAKSLGSELMIMGAYGHSRLREQVLGGATQHVLDHARLPVLFSH